jgi:AcrR family transcriptional regulator
MFTNQEEEKISNPRDRRHDSTRQKILDTARKILISQGLDSLSMRTLARQVDYSPAAIYKYFTSKEEILDAIREEFWELKAGLEASRNINSLPVPQRLYEAGKAYLDTAEAYPEHYLLVFNSPDSMPRPENKFYWTSGFGGLVAMIQEGVDDGSLRLPRGYTPTSMAFQAWFITHGIAMLRLAQGRDRRSQFDAQVDQIMRAFIDTITVQK